MRNGSAERALRASLLAAVLSLATFVAAPAVAGPITYQIVNYPNVQNGTVINGTITTDGTIGQLTNANITGFDIFVTPGSGPAFELSPSIIDPATNTAYSEDSIQVQASATQLYLNPVLGTYFHINDPFTVLDYDDYYNDTPADDAYVLHSPITGLLFSTNAGAAGGIGFNPMVIATAVPEPTSLALAGSAILGLAFLSRRGRPATR